MAAARRLVQFVNATVDSTVDVMQHAEVELWRTGVTTSGERFVGKAQALDPVRAVALATLEALRRVHPHATQNLEVVGVETVEVFEATFVTVAISAVWRGHTRYLTGFCRVVGFEQGGATARAVLAATNRFLGSG